MDFKVSKKAVMISLTLGVCLCLILLAGCSTTKLPVYKQVEIPTLKAYPANVNHAPNYIYDVHTTIKTNLKGEVSNASNN